MFRKILIAVVASVALLSPLALVNETQASPVARHSRSGAHGHYRNGHRHYRTGVNRGYRYKLLVRPSSNVSWRYVGSYGSRGNAWNVAHTYQNRGFQVMVR